MGQRNESILTKALKWPHGLLIPINVPLRSFNATLQERTRDETADYPPSLLCDYILRQFDNLKVPDLKRGGREALDNNHCLLLLDGLDEVPTDAQRKGVREAVEHFVARYPKPDDRHVPHLRLSRRQRARRRFLQGRSAAV